MIHRIGGKLSFRVPEMHPTDLGQAAPGGREEDSRSIAKFRLTK